MVVMAFFSSGKKKEGLRQTFELECKKFCSEFGYDFEELMDRCDKRLTEARSKKRMSDSSFFQAELEALADFKKKVIKRRSAKKAASSPDLEFMGGEIQDLTGGNAKPRNRYSVYPAIPIHENVPKEMEHFFGALVELRKSVLPTLRSSVELIRDKSYASQISALESLFDDLADYEEMRELPLVFNTYLVKVKNSSGNKDVIARASIDVYKMVVVLIKKVRKIMEWLQHPKAGKRGASDLNVIFEGEPLFIGEFAFKVNRKCSELLEVFGLERF